MYLLWTLSTRLICSYISLLFSTINTHTHTHLYTYTYTYTYCFQPLVYALLILKIILSKIHCPNYSTCTKGPKTPCGQLKVAASKWQSMDGNPILFNCKTLPFLQHFCILKNISQIYSFKKLRCFLLPPSHRCSTFSDLPSPDSLLCMFLHSFKHSQAPLTLPTCPLFTSWPLLVNLLHTYSSSIQPGILSTNNGQDTARGEVWNETRPIAL